MIMLFHLNAIHQIIGDLTSKIPLYIQRIRLTHQNAHYFPFTHKQWTKNERKKAARVSLLFNIHSFDIFLSVFLWTSKLHDNNSNGFSYWNVVNVVCLNRWMCLCLCVSETVLKEKKLISLGRARVCVLKCLWSQFIGMALSVWELLWLKVKSKTLTLLKLHNKTKTRRVIEREKEKVEKKTIGFRKTKHIDEVNWMENKIQTWKNNQIKCKNL